ncbi:hypothetical protein SMICM304S_05741 [Streptomyces microflavus]
MNALHSTSSSAVVTRLHDVGQSAEKSGARDVSGMRGCVRGVGRQHPSPAAEQMRKPYMTVVDATTGESTGDNGRGVYGEATGDRTGRAETEGAEAAFTAYVQERRASLYATAYHLTGDRFEAEDLLQSALFSTYRAWDRISDKAAVGGYLRRTMTNLHISAWRRRKLNEYPTEELPETVGDTDAMRGTELGRCSGRRSPGCRTPAHDAGPAVLRGPHRPGDRVDPRHQCRHGEVEHLAVPPPAARGRGPQLRT